MINIEEKVEKYQKNEDYREFVKLSWKILEWKFAYYHPTLIKDAKTRKKYMIPDTEYDQHEAAYRKLAEKLQEKPTASEMVDFDFDRPACQLVVRRLTGKNK